MLCNKQKKLNIFMLLMAVAVFLLAMAPGTVAGAVYVDASASGNNDGSSWTNAYNDLQDALAVATPGQQIWVAVGTYKPGSVRDDTFQLINGVALYGGFVGTEDPATFNLADRDFETNETILSGDLNGDDVGFSNNGENSLHVVTGSGTNNTAVLDGFTITAGNGNGTGYPSSAGGGMWNDEGSPVVTNCTFSGNSVSTFGGGMCNWDSSPTVTNCTFSSNSASIAGGGMYNFSNSSPTVTNCTFSGNSADSGGGGMFNYIGSPTVTNCTFSDNLAGGNGGGGMYNSNSSPTVTNCTFSGNSVSTFGGGMSNDGSSSPTVTNCTFSGNSANSGGGMSNWWSSPTVTNCTFSGNSASVIGGGMRNDQGSPTVTNCTFSGNSASVIGGGMYNNYSNPAVTNCTFSGNSGRTGGGMGNDNSSPTVTNCTFSGNSADFGGGMRNNYNSSLTVTNCTFSGNSAPLGGGIYNFNNSSLTLTNCILWGDTAASDGNEIAVANSSTIDVNYCDVKDGNDGIYNDGTGTVNWGSGNIDQAPLFVDADGPDDIVGTEDDNLRLLVGSLCIDAGDNSAVPAGVTTDLDGNPRIVAGIVDMGAFEAPLLDPIALLQKLVVKVIAMNLQQGISNSLDTKLDATLKALEDTNTNNDVGAINTLEAFINAVEAQSGNKLTTDQADELTADALEIIALLEALI